MRWLSVPKVRGSIPLTTLQLICMRMQVTLRGYCPVKRRGKVTDSQLYLLSTMPFSVAGCDRLQLGAAHFANSVSLLQVVDNLPHEQWYWILHCGAPGCRRFYFILLTVVKICEEV